MIRRYDMSRSDNFPVCSIMEYLCEEESGKIFIYTGFPVKSAILSVIKTPQNSEIFIDINFYQKDGFYIFYNNIPKNTVIKFSYQAL